MEANSYESNLTIAVPCIAQLTTWCPLYTAWRTTKTNGNAYVNSCIIREYPDVWSNLNICMYAIAFPTILCDDFVEILLPYEMTLSAHRTTLVLTLSKAKHDMLSSIQLSTVHTHLVERKTGWQVTHECKLQLILFFSTYFFAMGEATRFRLASLPSSRRRLQ